MYYFLTAVQEMSMPVFNQIKLGLVRQAFPASQRPNIEKRLAEEFVRAGFAAKIKPGHKVLITSGSRGIESMLEVLQNLVKLVKSVGGIPLMLPAMGSHGGGTAEGQVDVLAHLGQTEATLGAPIYTDYQPAQVGEVFDQIPVFVDKAVLAESTDHVILVGRVKEHTEFCGPIESGLLKMAVVGMGRIAGATSMHLAAVKYTYAETIKAMAQTIFDNAPVLGGIALVDDQHNVLRHLEAVPAAEIASREPELLVMSQHIKPKLPWDALDILLVDEIGKDISGAGFDTKVIGRLMNIYEKPLTVPAITRIVTRRISEKGGGNAIGLGLSDFITQRLYDAVDFEMTRINSVVAVSPEKGRCPIVAPDTKAALKLALETVGPWKASSLSMAWIQNTKDLEYIAVTPDLFEAARNNPSLEVIAPPEIWPWATQDEGPDFKEYLAKHK